MSTEQKKPADYTMRDGTPWWKFETMMPPSMDAPILLMNHESGAITPHKDGRYLYDEKDLWTPMPPEAPKATPSLPASPELLESVKPPVGAFIRVNSSNDVIEVTEHTERGFKYKGATPISIPRLGFYGTGEGEIFMDVPGYTVTWKVAALTPLWPSADGRKQTAEAHAAEICELLHGPAEEGDHAFANDVADVTRYLLTKTNLSIPTPSPVAGLPTPETDAHTEGKLGEIWVVGREFARSLERRLAAARQELTQTRENLYAGLDRNRDGITTPHLATVAVNALAAARAEVERLQNDLARIDPEKLAAQLATAKEERDEAIKAHGVVWNAVRKAASALRWLDIPNNHVALKEDAEAINEAEKLKPRWSTDWAIIGKCELDSLRSDLAKANAALEGLRAKSGLDEELIQGLQQQERETHEALDAMGAHSNGEEGHGKRQTLTIPQRLATLKKTVPPEARAVEAVVNCLVADIGKIIWRSGIRGDEYLSSVKAVNELVTQTIQRTCFPQSEGEEWAKKAALKIACLKRPTTANFYADAAYQKDIAALILEHAPARPTAARECGASEAWESAEDSTPEDGAEVFFVRLGKVQRGTFRYLPSPHFAGDCRYWHPAEGVTHWMYSRTPEAPIDAAMQPGGKTP